MRNNLASTNREIATMLLRNRSSIAMELIDSVSGWEKYSHELLTETSRQDFARRELHAFVDYLASYFKTGNALYRQLYLGEKLKQCYWHGDGQDGALARRRHVTSRDRDVLGRFANKLSNQDAKKTFLDEVTSLNSLITAPSKHSCRVLLIGDCFYLDLLSFVTIPLLESNIQLSPTFVTTKVLAQQQKELRDLQQQEFDLIFYNPLSYAFDVEFAQLQRVRWAASSRSQMDPTITKAKTAIKANLELLTELFECPIFVHNTANIRRHDGSVLDTVRTLITKPVRHAARKQINEWLSAYVDGLRSRSRIVLLDETLPFRQASELALSRTIYNSELQHPCKFANALAPVYEDIVVANSIMAKKKLIVCDLDNTLWRGLVGEGEIAPFSDRQATLQSLRKKGMLLAVCSKNDAKNITWKGCVLSSDDFVWQQVNWAGKAENIKRIAKQLNLKTKDFIFIDDRADERELVRAELPEIMVLDAEDPRTWAQLVALDKIFPENTEGDRTLAYKQREERERFLAGSSQCTDGEIAHPQAEVLQKLNLSLEIREARRGELGRVVELINRTNQFNMTGKRTTSQEIKRWQGDKGHAIFVAEASDKFGAMGVISVAVAERTTRGVEIVSFVLSCRVFGYGMENAIINRIKNWAAREPIYGRFVETPYNGPCRRTYADNGFTWNGKDWVFNDGAIADVPWLSVNNV